MEHERSLFRPDAPDDEHTAALTVDHLRVIALHVYPHLDFREQNVSVDELNLCINSISSRALTDEEAALGSFTRRKLKTLSTWPEWQAGERKQLDRFHAVRMFGEPVPRPADPKAIILRPHWQYKVKMVLDDRGTVVMDPLVLHLPFMVSLLRTHPVWNNLSTAFFALAAHRGHGVYGGDTTDAYAHSPPHDVPTFVVLCSLQRSARQDLCPPRSARSSRAP